MTQQFLSLCLLLLFLPFSSSYFFPFNSINSSYFFPFNSINSSILSSFFSLWQRQNNHYPPFSSSSSPSSSSQISSSSTVTPSLMSSNITIPPSLLPYLSPLSDECEKVSKSRAADSSTSKPHSHSTSTWGLYRPDIYFGLKSNTYPFAFMTGIMWAEGKTLYNRNFRHKICQNEVNKVEWIRNNGGTFGIRNIMDRKSDANITASFMIQETGWIQHFHVLKERNVLLPFLFYYGFECNVSESQERISNMCSRNNTLSNLEFLSMLEQNISIPDIPQYSTLTQTVLIGYSDHLGGWFSLSITSLGVSLTDVELDEVIISEGEKPFDYYSTLQSSSWCPSSYLGISDVVNKILRSSEVNRVRAMEVGQENLKSMQNSPDEYKQKDQHEGYVFDTETMMIPSSRIEKNSVGLVHQIMTRREFDVVIEYQVKPEWKSREDIVKSIGSRKKRFSRYLQLRNTSIASVNANIKDFENHFQDLLPVTSDSSRSADHEVALKCVSSFLEDTKNYRFISCLNFDNSEFECDEGKNGDIIPSLRYFYRENFHQQFISRWNVSIALETLSSWVNCMSYDNSLESNCSEGWNPLPNMSPNIFIVIDTLLDLYEDHSKRCDVAQSGELLCPSSTFRNSLLSFFQFGFPRLHNWLTGFIKAHLGPSGVRPLGRRPIQLDGAMRWRGREKESNELIYETPSSGFDDYPRGSRLTREEFHLDLLCWVIHSLKVMKRLQSILVRELSTDNGTLRFDLYSIESIYFFTRKLEVLHWSHELNGFFDVGIIGKREKIQHMLTIHCVLGKNRRGITQVEVFQEVFDRAKQNDDLNSLCPVSFPTFVGLTGDKNGEPVVKRVYISEEPRQLAPIPRIGYINLFPLLLRILEPDSPHLLSILGIIESPDHLWSSYGLRSLSKSDLFYHKENTPGMAPYWRGSINVNINYLALRALHHYSLQPTTPDLIRRKCIHIYQQLRSNLIENIVNEYDKTGYFWEQYDDQTGHGYQGNHSLPKTSPIYVNILYEIY